MSDATHEFSSQVASTHARTSANALVVTAPWSGLPTGGSRFQQVRRQLRILQVQRAAFGARAA